MGIDTALIATYIAVLSFGAGGIWRVAKAGKALGQTLERIEYQIGGCRESIEDLKNMDAQIGNRLGDVENWLQKNTSFEIRDRGVK
ncbi:MAG TPA: hypothetical protein V6C65_08565 [Allocoleopsis sp.]